MYRERPAETDQEHVEDLIHLYIDGAFDRRELLKRVATYTGSIAAAMAAVGPEIMAQTGPPAVPPANVSVPEYAEEVEWFWVQYGSEVGTLRSYFARPRFQTRRVPVILDVHENRGLNDHIKDVTRRVAKAGFVGFGIDLLSRVGGTDSFSDPMAATTALNRITPAERLSDIRAAIEFIKIAEYVRPERLGAVGFCFRGRRRVSVGVQCSRIDCSRTFLWNSSESSAIVGHDECQVARHLLRNGLQPERTDS